MKLLPVLVAVLAFSATAPAAHASGADCAITAVPVSGPTGPATVSGQLCTPVGANPGSIQLLVHGGTYNRAYWDLPGVPESYSYQRNMAREGRATFAVDRLGAGASTRPPSLPLLISAEARSLHEVVQHLRAGRIGGTAYEKVVTVGHSVGSGIVAAEAATYRDVDGVVLSGITHLPAVPVLALGAALGLQPVFLDDALARLGSDPLYFTTRPGARAGLFYSPDGAEQAVVAADEAAKDQVSVPGMGTVAVFGIVLPTTRGIDVPVFQAVGTDDVLFCGLLAVRDCSNASSLRSQEAPYYGPEAQLETYVLPGAGHSLALHRNAEDYRDATRAWLSAKLGM
ncbi:Lysophospholipase, alpha-beta hydrolase superfamily [Lentzea xinjiangensis]|uniref:Lysophospholipase, alpha-beta hydrolase superfamily n=1 Tax=Lentzea xinjiangensis TaxID=402600 RepID=A0A1H9UNG6_9PSEU|nr:alpha/beta fold hydrolase [Lentzea xinjiangensis]SES11006.1 Lysophospholipase, alpha-beta hydrolase superfamily [Lentzea xinjiangensis]